MNKKLNEKLTLTNHNNEFLFKKNISNLNISFNRIAFIFFVFLITSFRFSVKIFYFGSLFNKKIIKGSIIKKDFRSDIIDRNGNIIFKFNNNLSSLIIKLGFIPAIVVFTVFATKL